MDRCDRPRSVSGPSSPGAKPDDRRRRGPVTMSVLRIAPATRADASTVLDMIRGLAQFERLVHMCVATEDDLLRELFSPRPAAEVILAWEDGEAAGFALFFHNFSTFLGRRGLYLEDLFVRPAFRRRGYGRALLVYLARLAVERECGRFEWAVLDWNVEAIGFYQALGATVLPDWRITRVTGSALAALAAQPLVPDRAD
jgi:GNAT superfamily N-acetyltransferase